MCMMKMKKVCFVEDDIDNSLQQMFVFCFEIL